MKSACLLVFLIALATAPADAADTGDPDSVLARIWIQRAALLLSSGSPTPGELIQASSALEAASEFQPPGPDYRYLKALTVLHGEYSPDSDFGPFREAYEHARAAATLYPVLPATNVIPFERRALLLAELSLRLREYRSYLDAFDRWPRGHRNDVKLLYAAARSALYLGLDERAARLARRGESLVSPSDTLAEFDTGLADPRSVFRSLSVAAGDVEEIKTLPSALGRWGDDLESALEPWILNGRIEVAKAGPLKDLISPELLMVAALISGSAPYPPNGLPEAYTGDLSLAKRLLDPEDLKDRIAGYTGILDDDADYDGFPEDRLRILNGRPESRLIDSDQDGRYEWEIAYSSGQPVQIRLDAGRLTVNYQDGAYPEVLSMVSRGGPISGRASFGPGRFRWDPSGGDPLFGDLEPPDWDDSKLWNHLTRVVVRADDSATGEVGEATTWLDSGYPVRAMEMRYRRGEGQDPIWIRELVYEDGLPVAGRRSFRPHPENPSSRIWELYERYEKGKLVGLAWDPGMSGSPSYLRDWALETYLEIQVWDIDADGWLDARRFLGPGERVSTRELLVTEAGINDLLPWRAGDWWPWE